MRSVCLVMVMMIVAPALAAHGQRGFLVPTVKPVYKPTASLLESLEDWTRLDGKPITGWEIVDGELHKKSPLAICTH